MSCSKTLRLSASLTEYKEAKRDPYVNSMGKNKIRKIGKSGRHIRIQLHQVRDVGVCAEPHSLTFLLLFWKADVLFLPISETQVSVDVGERKTCVKTPLSEEKVKTTSTNLVGRNTDCFSVA